MKRLLALILFVGSSLAWAAPNPAEYAVNVHVVSSHLDVQSFYKSPDITKQILDVLIDGKKYELSGSPIVVAPIERAGLIVPGDYKAKITWHRQKGTYAYGTEYELLFPGQTTRKFEVVGQSE